jgi:o-succinylbenzoate synthase
MLSALPPLDRAEAYYVRVPFRRPFETADGVFATRNSWILRLRDFEGRDGFGEIALHPAAPGSEEDRLAAAVREEVAQLGAGRLPGTVLEGAAGLEDRALLAGLDEALGALERARLAGRTGVGTPVSVSVNATLDASAAAEAAESAHRSVAEGFTCLKLKVGPESTAALVDRVAAIRRAVPTSVRLRLDANCSWTHSMAVERLDALAPYDIEYVEQPLAAGDLEGHADLRRECSVPIALDESVDSDEAAAAALAAGAADVLVIKPARVGGPGVVREIAARAAAAGVPVVVSTFFETGIGTDAAVRAAAELPVVGGARAHGLATAGMLEHDLLQVSASVAGGRIFLPPELAVDDGALERYTVERIGSGR